MLKNILKFSIILSLVFYVSYIFFENTSKKIIVFENEKQVVEDRIFPRKDLVMKVVDLEKEIHHSKSKKYVLKKDLLIDLSLIFEKDIEIDGAGYKIFIESCVTGFYVKSKVKIKNVKILVADTGLFASIVENGSLEIENSKIVLQENSSFYIVGNNLIMKNNVIENHSLVQKDDSSLLEFVGENFVIENNTFIDNKNILKFSILINKSKKGFFNGNTIVSYLSGLQSPLLIDNSSNIEINDNIIFDRNTLDRSFMEKSNSQNEEGMIVDGTTAVGIYNSTNIKSQSGNYYLSHNILKNYSSTLIDLSKNKYKGSLIDKDYSLDKIDNCKDLRQIMKAEFDLEKEIFCL